MIPRYNVPEMAEIWSDEFKIASWIEIEAIAAYIMEGRKIIKDGLAQEIYGIIKNDSDRKVFVLECLKEEQTTQHDVVAFLNVLERSVGKVGRFVHYGLTSSDLVDTCLAKQMVKSIGLVVTEIGALCRAIHNKAVEHKHTAMMGRTHGMFAEPTTFGLVMLNFKSELIRNIDRLDNACTNAAVGKMSGAVGTYAHIPPAIEEQAMQDLSLAPEKVSSQIVSRDRHAEVVMALALLATTIERLALQIRLLSRSDVMEVAEGHGKGYKGSSAMPHKKNPIGCENLCGLARVVRGYVGPALESVALHHERDISHSSVERIILPDAFGITCYMIKKMTDIINKLFVDKEKMLSRVEQSSHQWLSQRTMLQLVNKGMSRQKAHSLVQHDMMGAMIKAKIDPLQPTKLLIKESLKNIDEIYKRFDI